MPNYKWIPCQLGQPLPHRAVHGGRDVDGTQIYVGRAYHEGDNLPAKVIPEKNVCYVAYGGGEHLKYNYEVLVEREFQWIPCSDGSVPGDAVVAGQTCDGEALYVGRVYHDGAQTVGKVQPSHGCLYVPFDGEERSFTHYEVLAYQ
ncbi:natterin-1-like [Trichogramma pretiosum]|uniref:natterin-1-like n=1 Tax=Trichogramma pretiosum TaxID=7493 RepID=UPI0006C9B7CA|nr:natterin-1-like [Trichogramma pretiosum]